VLLEVGQSAGGADFSTFSYQISPRTGPLRHPANPQRTTGPAAPSPRQRRRRNHYYSQPTSLEQRNRQRSSSRPPNQFIQHNISGHQQPGPAWRLADIENRTATPRCLIYSTRAAAVNHVRTALNVLLTLRHRVREPHPTPLGPGFAPRTVYAEPRLNASTYGAQP